MGKMTRHLIPHSRPTFGREEEQAVLRAIRSGMVGSGEEVGRFERELERQVGGGRVVAVHSGSAALHLALLGLGIRPGDRVVVPSYVCAAVLNAVNYTGAEPIVADVDPATANLDPGDVRRRLRAGTKAIIAPHMLGRTAPIRELRGLGVPVVEDCAMALGGEVGCTGEVSVFSFYATKMMATGHGGAVAARDRRIVARIADLVEYDNRSDYKVRYNYRMSALAAALGRVQLAKLPEFVQRRRQIADYYYRTLSLGEPPPGHVFYRFLLRVGSIGRFVRFMGSRGVDCKRPVFRPLHRLLARTRGEYPGAEELQRHGASIPLYPSLTRAEMRRVGESAREFLG